MLEPKLTTKKKGTDVEFYIIHVEEVLDHNMISDHIGSVIMFNIELNKMEQKEREKEKERKKWR